MDSTKKKNANLFSTLCFFFNFHVFLFYFCFYIIGFPEVPGLKLLQSHNPAQRAVTQHNNDICEWTCLYGPLPHTEDMISEEWKPFEKFIFKQNTGSRRAAAWRCEAQSHSAGRWAHVRSSVYLPVFSPWLYYTSLCVCLHRGFVGFFFVSFEEECGTHWSWNKHSLDL